MGETSKLLQLANTIQAQVSEIQKHLMETKQSDPEFDGQVETTDWDGTDDTRSAALENLTQLQDLLMTPRELLQSRWVRSQWLECEYSIDLLTLQV